MQPYPLLFAYLRAAGWSFLLIVGGMMFSVWLRDLLKVAGWQDASQATYMVCLVIGLVPALRYLCRELDVPGDLIDYCVFAALFVGMGALSNVLPPRSWGNKLLGATAVLLFMLQHVVRGWMRLKVKHGQPL